MDSVVTSLHIKKNLSSIPSLFKKIIDDRVKPLTDEDKDKYRKLVARYVRQYGFIAQLMDFTDPDLEKYYIFCKMFYKFLPYTIETLPMEILDLIDLDKLRIQLSFEGFLELEDENAELKSSRIGEIGQKKEDEKKTVAEILDMANSPFANILDENDKILKQIWDAVLEDPEVTDAFHANNSYDILMNIVKEKFDEKIFEQIDKYMNLQSVLEKERTLSVTLIRKFVDALAERTANGNNFVYDESVLKDKIYEVLKTEFEDVCHYIRGFNEIVDNLFFVLNSDSIPSLDGVDEMVKTTLNNLFANPNLRLVDKRVYFNSLVAKYEAYLRKLYYLIHNEEVQPYNNGTTTTDGLANASHSFDCLWGLKNNPKSEYQKFSAYLNLLRQWRNDEVHLAPNAVESEVDAAIKIVTSMYLFVTGCVITDLEMAGF